MQPIRIFGDPFRTYGAGGGVSGILYLLRDKFTTAVAAPLAATRAAEPGPGTLTKNADTGNRASITASGFVWASGPGNYTADPNYVYDAVTRVAGRVVGFRVVTSGSLAIEAVGLSQNAVVQNNWVQMAHAVQFANTVFSFLFNNTANMSSSNVTNITTTTTYDIAIVLHTAGALWLLKGGVFTDWYPVWNELITSTATVYPFFVNHSATYAHQLFAVADFGGSYVDDYPKATVNVASPATGVNYSATADGLHEMRFTLPGSPSAGDRVNMQYRIQDANNYWVAYAQRNVGNTDWDFRVDSVAAGTPTNRLAVTGVGNIDTIVAVNVGLRQNFYTKTGSTYTKRGSEVNTSHTDTATGINATYAVGTVARLSSIPAGGWSELTSFLA